MSKTAKQIFKRKGSPYWQYRFTVDGEEFRGSTGTEDAVRADEYVTREKNRLYDEKNLGKKPNINLTDAFKKFYVEYAQHLKSGKVSIPYQIMNLSRFFGNQVNLNDIDDRQLNRYVVYRRAQKVKGKKSLDGTDAFVSPSTVNRELSAFRKMYNLAKDKWKVTVADCDIKSHFLMEPDQHQEYLTEAEQEAIMEHAPKYLKNPIRFALITGVRRANVIGLQWDDIKNDEITFRIKSQLPEGKILTLPVTEELQEIFDEEAESNPDMKGLVFTKGDNEPLGDFRKALYTAFKKAGIDRKKGHGFHLFRHSSATTKLKNGVDIATVQELHGHHDISTTRRYIHINKDDLRSAMKKQYFAQNAHNKENNTNEK